MKILQFTYLFTHDLEKMGKFYEKYLELNCGWNEEDNITFMIEDHQLSINYDVPFEPPTPEFSREPD